MARTRGGRRRTCKRAKVRAVLHLASAHAPRDSVSAAMIDAAHACACDACPGWLRRLEGAQVDRSRVLGRDAKKAERIGARAMIGDGMAERAIADRNLLKQAGERAGARGERAWHAKQRAEESANAAFDAALTGNTTNETEG